MAKTSLQVKAKNAATERATNVTITYVNPEADSATLKQFGQMLNGFTNNVYEETNRIQTINVDTEEVPSPLENIGTLSLVQNPTITREDTYIKIAVTQFIINGQPGTDGVYLFGTYSQGGTLYPIVYSSAIGGDHIRIVGQPPAGQGTLTLALTPKSPYTAATLMTNITIPS